MRTVTILGALVTLSALAACSTDTTTAPTSTRPTFAVGTQCRSVAGSIGESSPSWFELAGSISGDITGQAFGKVTSSTHNYSNETTTAAMEHRFVLPDGEIHTSDKATFRRTDDIYYGYAGWSTFNSRLTIVGGTGAYVGASGMLRASGIFNPATPPGYEFDGLEVTYTGRLCIAS